jgi:aminoglycoside phosphotransferase (APT) family kinase protein
MNDHFEEVTLRATGAQGLISSDVIQSLWSGYGEIVRCGLSGSSLDSVVVKHVHWPDATHHPRGWNTDVSHERKVRSYQVETVWYERWAARCGDGCRVPKCFALEAHGDEVFMVLEDLDASGFSARRSCVTDRELRACLSWLAHFHATFMEDVPEGLWEIGTYWHLETRLDELEGIADPSLKGAAEEIDRRLSDIEFKTLVHGDAKLANFCFSRDGENVAAVDFQYVGGGCGMKDVAYFISSCLDENDSERQEAALLDCYFDCLRGALDWDSGRFQRLESEWRALYPVAWTDFFRFLQGWSPGHWKIHRYSQRLAREVLEELI